MTTTGTVSITAKSEREIVMTRAFDAPRELVFKALTTPALVQRWLLGTPGWVLAVCEIDLRVGGKFRYVWQKGDKKMGMGGVFKEVDPPDRMVHTEMFDEDWTAGEAVCTTTLTEEKGGGTRLTWTMVYSSPEVRDMVLKSGMERGVIHSFDLLAVLLAEQQQ